MKRAFIRGQEYIWVLWLRRNPAITETPIVEARTARHLKGGVEIKSISITRLKLSLITEGQMLNIPIVEIKSISITRLKR